MERRTIWLSRGAMIFVLLSLALLAIIPTGQAWAEAKIPEINNFDATCEARLEEFTRNENWYVELADPVLSSEAEIQERLDAYSGLHACLDGQADELAGHLRTLHTLTEYFLIFAGGYQTPKEGSELILVNLAESDDPGVVQLRDEAGLPPPHGFVYVRSYTSRESMPERLQAIFADRQVAGVTIYTRYIAVLDEQQGSFQRDILHRQALPRTVSHELIHAYVHSSISLEDLGRLPKWYNEGLAIYFSGSGENQTLVTPNSVLMHTTTAEYRLYRDNFDYLEDKLGRERFLELIRISIEEMRPELIYEDLEIEDERYLQRLAQGWRQRQVRQGQALSLAAVLALSLFVLWMVPSGVTCSCGYHDHKKAFASGYCPNCRRKIELSRESVKRQPRPLVLTCQVCRRQFWLWNSNKVKRLPAGTMVWVERQGDQPLEEPVRESVSKICEDCRKRAVDLAEAHQHMIQEEIEEARRQTTEVYERWLRNAPQVSYYFQQGLKMYTFEEALEQCVAAALADDLLGRQDQVPDFRFREFSERQRDFRQEPPGGYENVLTRQVTLAGSAYDLYGTVRLFEDERIGIHWVLNA